MSELEKFLQERSNIPIPNGDAAWVKLLAKEIVLGIHKRLWSPVYLVLLFNDQHVQIEDSCFKSYLETRWQDYELSHITQLLKGHGYLEYGDSRDWLTPTEKAYELVGDVEPYNVFISYRRLDSSAFALLVLARLKEHSLIPYVDMALEAGGNWHADLEERIKDCDYFIVLLGQETLASEMTVKEICWAMDSKRTIIPIWHNEFGRQPDFRLSKHIDKLAVAWEDDRLRERKDDVRDVIQQTNAIRVTDESASGYNTAIVELLNRFGITP